MRAIEAIKAMESGINPFRPSSVNHASIGKKGVHGEVLYKAEQAAARAMQAVAPVVRSKKASNFPKPLWLY